MTIATDKLRFARTRLSSLQRHCSNAYTAASLQAAVHSLASFMLILLDVLEDLNERTKQSCP